MQQQGRRIASGAVKPNDAAMGRLLQLAEYEV
jgi:hypothetical protein